MQKAYPLCTCVFMIFGSFLSSAKQRRKVTNFCTAGRTWTTKGEFLGLYFRSRWSVFSHVQLKSLTIDENRNDLDYFTLFLFCKTSPATRAQLSCLHLSFYKQRARGRFQLCFTLIVFYTVVIINVTCQSYHLWQRWQSVNDLYSIVQLWWQKIKCKKWLALGVLSFLKTTFCFKISKVDVGANSPISAEPPIPPRRNLNSHNCYNTEYYITATVTYINACIENYLCRELNY